MSRRKSILSDPEYRHIDPDLPEVQKLRIVKGTIEFDLKVLEKRLSRVRAESIGWAVAKHALELVEMEETIMIPRRRFGRKKLSI